MINFFYLDRPKPIPGTDTLIVGVGRDGSAYGVRERDYTGDPGYDSGRAFSLLPYFTRLAERGDDVPDYDELRGLVAEAKRELGFPQRG